MSNITRSTLGNLVREDSIFLEKQALVSRLVLEKKESRYLEWKSTLPIGLLSEHNAKYRTIKVAASFANTDGGFIVFHTC